MSSTHLLIVGGESDPNTQRIVDQAHIRQLDYVFWDTNCDNSKQIAWDFESPELDLGASCFIPRSVFLRFDVFGTDTGRSRTCFDAIQSYVLAWPEVKILNRLTLTDSNNKSKNLGIARNSGFTIPNTIVLADLTPLATLPDPKKKAVKPLNGGAHTQNAKAILDQELPLHQLEPQFVQECLEGENLRVFVIDGELFCFHLQSSLLDYREDPNVQVVKIDVPHELIEPTRRLVRALGFDYCALDFRCRTKFESPVFLEVNSFPMFVRFDDAGENCLADKIIDFLTR